MPCKWCSKEFDEHFATPPVVAKAPRVACAMLQSHYLETDPPRVHERAPVRSDRTHDAGTISWAEHLEAWERYVTNDFQEARGDTGVAGPEVIAADGGFTYSELCHLLGRAPASWQET